VVELDDVEDSAQPLGADLSENTLEDEKAPQNEDKIGNGYSSSFVGQTIEVI